MVFFELRDRLKEHFAYSRKEVRDLLVVVAITGFIFSFRDWGSDAVDIVIGLRNFVLAIGVAALTFLVHTAAQRVFAIMIGYKAEFKIWYGGLFTSLILAFASNGVFTPILHGGLVNSILVRHRLGEFRYGLNYWENGWVALYGAFATLALAVVAKIGLAIAPNSWMLQKLLIMNLVLAVCCMLPLPQLEGINVFFGGRLLYVMSFLGILGTAILIYFTGIIWAIIGGLLIMAVGTILYYIVFEKE